MGASATDQLHIIELVLVADGARVDHYLDSFGVYQGSTNIIGKKDVELVDLFLVAVASASRGGGFSSPQVNC